MRAAMHAHSTFSDGEFTIPELRRIFLGAGCRVLCITDHAEHFDGESLGRYIDACRAASDDAFLVLPGLEFGCERRMHVLGYGVTTLCDSTDPADVIRHIEANGGVSVIAHPKTDFFDWIRGFEVLPDGIEAWNSKYDGRHAPRPETFDLIAGLRERKPSLHAFYGIDLHWRKQFRELHVELETGEPADTTRILEAMKAGRFAGVYRDLRLDSAAGLPADLRDRFGRAHRRHMRLRNALSRAKRWTDAIGLRAPERVKAQLRRLF